MGFMDKIRGKVSKAVDDHGEKISDGIDKAGAAVDKKTGGKHHDKIEKATTKAKDGLDKLDGKDDDLPNQPNQPNQPT